MLSNKQVQMVREVLSTFSSGSGFKKRYAKELAYLSNPENAVAVLLGVIKLQPKAAFAYRLLAEVEQSIGRLKRAALAIEQWLNIEPLSAVAWHRLAVIRHSLGQSDRAVAAYERTTELAPGEILQWVGLALAALSAQKLGTAIRARDCLLERFPDTGLTHLVDGHVKKVQSARAGAIAAYRRALELAPDLMSAVFNLVELEAPSLDDPLTRRLKEIAGNGRIDGLDEVNLHFALGRIYEVAQHYDAAFVHYKKGNDATIDILKTRGISYDPQFVEECAENTIRMFSEESFRQPIEPLEIDLKLIFIVGLPRSGTTLVEQIVGSHSKVIAGGELTIVQSVHRQYMQRRAALKLGNVLNGEDSAERELLLEMRELYVDKLFARDLDGEYITDKLPGNFEYLGFIRLLFPDAIIIHNKRHLVATSWSLYSSNFAMHEPYYNSLTHLLHYCRMYQGLMQHWAAVLKPPMIEVRYETLVKQPEYVIRDLVARIGLPWEKNCLMFYEQERPVLTASYEQVRQPIYTSSVERWRNYRSYLTQLDSAFGHGGRLAEP